ncbi:MAG TPA: hypothetical protein VEC35_25210 [Noviherbaspirillum sp.]|nr:hypothetical protein [Noviherbaspirillum sp.]
MDAEGILSIVALLLHSRTVLCLICTSIAAYVLVFLFPWLSGLQGIMLAALGLGLGAAWEACAQTNSDIIPSPNTETTRFVAVTTAALAGGFWGVTSASAVKSMIAGAVILAIAAYVWHWYATEKKMWVSKDRAFLCIGASVLSYAVGAWACNAYFA